MNFHDETLYMTFNHFNRLLFNNSIKPTPTIKINRSKKNAGLFEGFADEDNNPVMTIKISSRHNTNYYEFCETLIHEMVHCYQFLNGLDVNHGKVFKQIRKVIKAEYNIDIK